MKTYNHNMLPSLGVSWHHFPTAKSALHFANWAESETRNWENPCEAFVEYDCLQAPDEQYVVKVRNW